MPSAKNTSVDLFGKNIRCRVTIVNGSHHDIPISSVRCYIRRKKVAERKLYAEKHLNPLEVHYSSEHGVLTGDPELLVMNHIEFIFARFIIGSGECLTLELTAENKVRAFDITEKDINSAKDWSKYPLVIPIAEHDFNNN